MALNKAVLSAFSDELQKIAGELQGFTRIGRKPISVERMLERETEQSVAETPSGIIENITKSAAVAMSPKATKNLALVGLGAAGYHQVTKAKRRYDIGRQVERQGM